MARPRMKAGTTARERAKRAARYHRKVRRR
jgi:hypothetical protein